MAAHVFTDAKGVLSYTISASVRLPYASRESKNIDEEAEAQLSPTNNRKKSIQNNEVSANLSNPAEQLDDDEELEWGDDSSTLHDGETAAPNPHTPSTETTLTRTNLNKADRARARHAKLVQTVTDEGLRAINEIINPFSPNASQNDHSITQILQRLGIPSHASHATKERGTILKQLRSAIRDNAEKTANEDRETMMRRAGYWNYVSKSTYNAMARKGQIWDPATGGKVVEVVDDDEEEDEKEQFQQDGVAEEDFAALGTIKTTTTASTPGFPSWKADLRHLVLVPSRSFRPRPFSPSHTVRKPPGHLLPPSTISEQRIGVSLMSLCPALARYTGA